MEGMSSVKVMFHWAISGATFLLTLKSVLSLIIIVAKKVAKTVGKLELGSIFRKDFNGDIPRNALEDKLHENLHSKTASVVHDANAFATLNFSRLLHQLSRPNDF